MGGEELRSGGGDDKGARRGEAARRAPRSRLAACSGPCSDMGSVASDALLSLGKGAMSPGGAAGGVGAINVALQLT